MYHCRFHFYLVGPQCRAFEIIKEMSPLKNFEHEFFESEQLEESHIAIADVIFVVLQGENTKDMVQALLQGKKKEAELILFADKKQTLILKDQLREITDIWTIPMSDEEVTFRFLRWQQKCQMSKDFWQTRQYLDATINHIPNLIWYKDKNGIHEKVNDSFCAVVNKTKKQVEGRGHAYIWDVEHDDPACVASELEVMRKNRTCVSEETVKSGDGLKQLTTYKSPLYDIDGTVMGTVGVAIDVTQERAYEQEIIKKNFALETLFATSDCGLLVHTIDGSRVIRVNRAALKILGYESLDELMSTGFDMIADSVMDDDKPRLRESISALKKEGDSTLVEYSVQHKDGQIRHVIGNINLQRENGELCYQRFLLDCTEQKLQERKEKLENEKRQMELLQALSIDYSLVCYFNADTGMGSTIRMNDCPSHILHSFFSEELPLKESLERYIQTCVCEQDRELLRQAISPDGLNKELVDKNSYQVNYRTICNGVMRYFQMKAVRLGTGSGSQGVVLGFSSVDEETRNEMEQKSLLEKALLQANKANEAKSKFLSNMSHDIRTPMNAIVGFTELAISKSDCKEQVEDYLGKIKSSGEHLLSLINDVLDMSRIESGKIHLEEKLCSLPDILQGLRNILQADMNAKQLKFCMDIADMQQCEVYCDELRLKQVLLNLLGNSIKYTNAGDSVLLRVKEKPGAPEGCANYEFYVKDTGIGMSKEFVAHIFEPFERERNSTISKIQGTGLGMSITKNLVDMMNGSIQVNSEQNIGTEVTMCFTFRLNQGEKLNTCEEPKSLNTFKKPLTTGRILLVEDLEINQEIAASILESAGYSVEIAENGQIAVDMLKNSEHGYYQLVLMDIQMPVMNGYESTREIRKLEDKELASIPILAMSANAFEEDRQEALRCGMNGHIAKPIDIKSLFETLNTILV